MNDYLNRSCVPWPGKILLVLLALTLSCFADTVYDVSIDTSSIAGSDGGLYLQFNPGLAADPASISIDSLNLGGGSLLSSPAPIFDGGSQTSSSSLSSLPLVIDNRASLNDFEQFLQFGTSLDFQVTFHLPSTLSGQSGSIFNFETDAFDPNTSSISPILTGDPSGFIGSISFDQNGAFSMDTLGNDAVLSIRPVSEVPEPSNLVVLTMMLGFGAYRIRQTR